MATLSDEAKAQINELVDHFKRGGRDEAADLLFGSVRHALVECERVGTNGRAFPATYRDVTQSGTFWIKVHRYWFCYTIDGGDAVIVAVFYDEADIPRRFGR